MKISWRKLSDSLYNFFFVQAPNEPRASWKIAIWNSRGDFLQVALIAVTATVSLYLFMLFGPRMYGTLNGHLGGHASQLIFATCICIAGVVAHRYKQKQPRRYGFVEVWVGGASAYAIAFSMDPSKPDFAKWASLIGAGYVIARGLNNIKDARGKKCRARRC